MSLPTVSEEYAKLMEHLRKAQEASSMIAHLVRDDNRLLAQGWLGIGEMFKMVQHKVTQMAIGRMN